VEAIAQTSHASSLGQALRIDAELTRLGYPTEPLAPFNVDFSHLKGPDGQWWSTHFFLTLGEIESPIDGTLADRWWCTELFALMQLLNVAKRPMEDFREALEGSHRQDTVTLARIYAALNGINLAKVADQVRMYTAGEDQRLEDIAFLTHPNESDPVPLIEGSEYVNDTVRIVTSSCGWHARLACVLLADLTDNSLAAELASKITDLPIASRYWTAAAVCILTDDLTGTASQLLEHDYQTRCGVAMIVGLDEETADKGEILQTLRLDRDLCVRIVAGGSEEGPPRAEIWTCRSCDSENPVGEQNCQSCTHGSKPRPNPADSA
jgi:hypothetical protein